jgi:hypothetical protein
LHPFSKVALATHSIEQAHIASYGSLTDEKEIRFEKYKLCGEHLSSESIYRCVAHARN